MSGFNDHGDIHSIIAGLLYDYYGIRYYKIFWSAIYDPTTSSPSDIWQIKTEEHFKKVHLKI